MIQVFEEMDYENQQVACNNCGWTDDAGRANVIDFYGVSSTKEIHCPQCDNTIGVIQNRNDSDLSNLS